MGSKRWRVVRTEKFAKSLVVVTKNSPRAEDFVKAVEWAVERNPSKGYQWGKIWCWSSVSAGGLQPLSVFYVFDDTTVRLLEIVETVLM